MPFALSFDIKRAGYAEQFVERLKGTSEQMLNEILSGISDDIAVNAPRKTGGLASSFYTIPATILEPGVLEGYIASSKAAQARAHEWGSGLYGPKMARYRIPKDHDGVKFQKEGKTLSLPFVMHPGVIGQFYIQETLRVWRPAIARKFGEAIRLAAVSRGWMKGIL